MDKIKEICIKSDSTVNEYHKNRWELIEKAGLKNAPKYAVDHPDYKDKYTEKEIKEYKSYSKKLENFEKTNKEYLDLQSKMCKETSALWEKQEKLTRKIAVKDAKNFLEDNKGKYMFIVEYSDNEGKQETLMEHGNIFKNVPYVRISKH